MIVDEILYDPEPVEDLTFPLPSSVAEPFDVTPDPAAYSTWVKHGGDPLFYPFSLEEYGRLEHWWMADLATYSTSGLDEELEWVGRRLAEIRVSSVSDDPITAAIAVMERPIVEARADWLAYEIKRRAALPEPPKAGYRIPSDFVHRLKDSCNLAELLSGRIGVPLKQQGRDYLGLCPFHTEKTPSFRVHENAYHCFGCGQSGDVFDILLVSSTCRTWREAVEYVANYVGVSMPKAPAPTRPSPSRPTPTVPEPIWSKYSA